MAKSKNATTTDTAPEDNTKPSLHDHNWTDYVLGLLLDDEKIAGNPTTDGLRRIFEIALNCTIINADSTVVQTPDIANEKRATVVHTIQFVLNDKDVPEDIKYRAISGSADVYWGNCDKIFRNHPVAVAETRAEGRALRRALRLRKVVAAEELADEIEDRVDGLSVNKISSNQINFIDVIAQRLNINVISLLQQLDITCDTIYNIKHEDAVSVIQKLNHYQQNMDQIENNLIGYNSNWK